MSIRSFRFLLPAALLALAACERPAKPATVVPDAPVVVSFTASSSRVTAGTEVTLTWKVEHATSISLTEATGAAVPGVAEDAFESSVKVTVNASAVYVLTARGEAGSDTRLVNVDVPGTATTVLFRVLPTEIVGGDIATLIWSAPGYGAVTITDDSNATVDLAGQTETGSVEVKPSRSTVYTLKAGDKTLTANVKVNANVLSFKSSVQAAQPGEMVTLSWTTAGASKVTLSSAGRGDLTTTTTAADVASGSFVDTIPASTPNNGVISYTLTIEGDAGASVSRAITVYVATGIEILSFTVPPLTKAATPLNVAWQTVAADSVELSVDGAVIYLSPTPGDARNGNFTLTAPGANFAVTLKATNARGDVDIVTRAVDVVTAPTSATLTANPTSVAAGTKTTLTWASPNARRVRIVSSDGHTVGSATGTAAENGSVDAYPSSNTTYTVYADNTLGDPAVTGTAQVTVTGTAPTLTRSPRGTAVYGTGVTLSYPQDSAAVVYGLPHSTILTGTTSAFIDIKGTGNRVQFGATTDDEVTTIDPAFETYLYGQRVTAPVSVSTNGWMSFGTQTAPRASESTFPTSSAAPFMLAPFWDNLRMRDTAGIFWQVVGNAPEQKLIVQWDDVQVGADTATALTFQVQVHQLGQVSFHYKTVTLAVGYSSFGVGVQGPLSSTGLRVTTAPTTNSSVLLFTPTGLPLTLPVQRGVNFNGFVKVGTGYLRVTSAFSAISLPSDVRITELNFSPDTALPNGQWVELYNNTLQTVDLTDWSLVSSTGTSYVFPAGSVPPASTLVVGASTDSAENDDAGVSIDWNALTVNPIAGSLALAYLPDASVSLSWDAGLTANLTGQTISADPNPYLIGSSSTLQTQTCFPSATYGYQTTPQKGTPGSVQTCSFGYVMMPIAASYLDIRDAGTSLMTYSANVDGVTVPITLPVSEPAPVYFGTPRPVISMSNDGWIAPYTYSSTNFTNKTTPSTTNPRGILAVLWDDAHTLISRPEGNMHYKRMAANEDPNNPGAHWIFQWTEQAHYNATADVFNYQVKWFDTGVIEYHYSSNMVSASADAYAAGGSSTIWLESNDGGVALPIGVNTPVIEPNSAYRFIPR